MTDTQDCYANMLIADGLPGYFAAPQGPQTGAGHPGVVVMMEAFGLTKHIAQVCDELAAAGFAALAPDIYYGETIPYSEMDRIYAKIRALDDVQVMAEVGKSLEFLKAQGTVDPAKLGITGYCMGGRFSFLASARFPDAFAASVAFYGGGIAPEGSTDQLGRKGPIAEAAALKAPLLLVYGAEDSAIGPAEQARIVRTLAEGKKRFTLSLYPGAGHGFCCAERESFHPAAAAASTQEAIAFLDVHLK